VSKEFVGVGDGEGADCKVEDLEAVGGAAGLGVGGLGGVEGERAEPGRRRWRAGPGHGYRHIVGGRDVSLYLLQGLFEVGGSHLLHLPFRGRAEETTPQLKHRSHENGCVSASSFFLMIRALPQLQEKNKAIHSEKKSSASTKTPT